MRLTASRSCSCSELRPPSMPGLQGHSLVTWRDGILGSALSRRRCQGAVSSKMCSRLRAWDCGVFASFGRSSQQVVDRFPVIARVSAEVFVGYMLTMRRSAQQAALSCNAVTASIQVAAACQWHGCGAASLKNFLLHSTVPFRAA